MGLETPSRIDPRTRPHVFSYSAIFLALLAWSGYAYATVRVNADIVAEAIQVQQWLEQPFWVWSYPGQLHGGVLEYPLIAVAETLLPGNVYALTLIRVLYVPITGVLVASCFAMAMPRRSLWPFAVAAAVGPAVLHGFRMISDIYPSAWLLSALGVWIVFRGSVGRFHRIGWLVAGGFLVGLGIYQHASAVVFAAPLLVFSVVRWQLTVRRWMWVLVGLSLGLIPMALAWFTQPGKEIVYRPERTGLPDVLGAFGLDPGELGWRDAMLPNGLGVTHADSTFLDLGWGVQWWINLASVGFVVAVVVAGIAFRKSPLGWMWLTAIAMIVGLVLVVPPVWYYGTPLGFLLWFSLGFTPVLLTRAAEWVVVAVVLALSAGFSFAQVWNSHPRFLTGTQVKAQQAVEVSEIALGIEEAGVEYVFGDYWEVLPVAYASSGALHPITYNYNRFPLTSANVGEEIVVALTPGTIALPFGRESWTLSPDATSLANEVCTPIANISQRLPDGVTAHLCPTDVLMERR